MELRWGHIGADQALFYGPWVLGRIQFDGTHYVTLGPIGGDLLLSTARLDEAKLHVERTARAQASALGRALTDAIGRRCGDETR